MKPINVEEWVPADGICLEENANNVARESNNTLVVAGPGAGKTELLAQKACFLLQTNTCKYPHKILAISFKRDAAYNLKERVRIRCGDELSKRFDSLTFDSFAKQILDRFKQALPDAYKILSEYDIIFNDRFILDFYESEDPVYYNTTHRDSILDLHNAPLDGLQSNVYAKLRDTVWKRIIAQNKLSFKMIMRLAELIVINNPKIKHYLQETYHFVFLDEFQDTTEIQYAFFKHCFLPGETFLTAVGDDKQRIMVWAGAQKTIFEDFMADTRAGRMPLTMNFRCAPRLVTLLNHLTEHLLRKSDFATPSPKWSPEEGECFVWTFDNYESEMKFLCKKVKSWITEEGINPRDICILVKQQLAQYAGELIDYFNANGVNARDENRLQDLLTEEISIYIINVLFTIFQHKANDNKAQAFSFLSNLHTELEDDQLLKLEVSFSKFIKKTRNDYKHDSLNDNSIKDLISEIVAFAGKDRIKACFPAYRNNSFFDSTIKELQDELQLQYQTNKDVILALDKIIGKDTIPVMTIHKSKGLEYQTVIFVGLEDGAFWSFQTQEDEDKCSFFVALSRAKERVVFTFSELRLDRFGRARTQSTDNIKIFFDELKKSGIVEILGQKL